MNNAPKFSDRTPDGDDRVRRVCDRCGFVDYVNPRIVVGSVCAYGDAILMCRRAIEPRRDFWTLPAGYLESHEATEAGARREAYEEACADIEIETLLAVYDIPRISQVQIMFRARLLSPDVRPGVESLDVRLFAWSDIPWNDLAFPSVAWALRHFDAVRGQTAFPPFRNPTDPDARLNAFGTPEDAS